MNRYLEIRAIGGLVLGLAAANAGHAQGQGGEALVEVMRSDGILAGRLMPSWEVDATILDNPAGYAEANGLGYLGVVSGNGELRPQQKPFTGAVMAFEDPEKEKTFYVRYGARHSHSPGQKIRPFALAGSNMDEAAWLAQDVSDELLTTPILVQMQRAQALGISVGPPIILSTSSEDFRPSGHASLQDYLDFFDELPGGAIIVDPDKIMQTTGEPTGAPDYLTTDPWPSEQGDEIPVVESLPTGVVDVTMRDPGDPPPESGVLECEMEGGPIPCAMGAVPLHRGRNEYGLPYCSGIVISPRHLLTAAHCAFGKNGHIQWDVHLSERLDHVSGEARYLDTAELVARFPDVPDDGGETTDPGWQDPEKADDGFYETPDLVIYRRDADEPFHGVRVTRIYSGNLSGLSAAEMLAFGYGTHPNESVTGYKQRVMLGAGTVECPEVVVPGQRKCDPVFEFINAIPEQRVAGVSDTITLDQLPPDTCVGDSGGPVFARAGGAWSLAAITSRPSSHEEEIGADPLEGKCTGKGGIYVRLSFNQILSWIDQILVQDGCTKVSGSNWVKYPDCGV